MLNLGVEGMMIVGAVVRLRRAPILHRQSTLVGALAGIVAGAALAAVFALLTLRLAANQVATGLALTIFGRRPSGADRRRLRRRSGSRPRRNCDLPVLTDLPFVGPILFGQDAFVYALGRCLWSASCVVPLSHARRAGAARDRRQSTSPPMRSAIRCCASASRAVLFGGACAGLAGAYLSLAYTPFWVAGMTAGRGWIALALVVFASWRPWPARRLGAYLFGGVRSCSFTPRAAVSASRRS